MEVVQKAASAWAKEANERLEASRQGAFQSAGHGGRGEEATSESPAPEPAVPRFPSYVDGRPTNMYAELKNAHAQALETPAPEAEPSSQAHAPTSHERLYPDGSESPPHDPADISGEVPTKDNEDRGDRLSWSEDREPVREQEQSEGDAEPQRNPEGLSWSEHRNRDHGFTR